MKRLFITALFAILMGGFTLTANAQFGETKPKGQVEDAKKADEAKPTTPGKITNEANQQSLQTNEYQPKVDAFQKAVNEFVSAYKNQKDQTETTKNKPVDLEKLLAAAEKARETVQPYYEKLSKSQKNTFDKANKELEKTKAEFYQK